MTNDDLDIAGFRQRALEWLHENASLRCGVDDWSERRVHADAVSEAKYFERCREWQRKLYDSGYAAISWPPDDGGAGLSAAHAIAFDEVAAAFDVTTGFFGSIIALVGPVLRYHGTQSQRARFLRPLLRGDEVWCQLFSEPGAGSDLAGLATRAVRSGDEFIVSGQKVWTSAAHHADFGMLLARTDPLARKHRGITLFALDMRQPGVEVRPLRQMTGAAHFNEVFFTDARVPAANVIGDVDAGWGPARTVLANESVMIGSGDRMARTQALVDLARTLGESESRGPLRRQRLADLWLRERILGWMAESVKSAARSGRAAPIDGSVLKIAWAQNLARRGDLALEVLGARGAGALKEDSVASFWWSEAMSRYTGSIGGGTLEVHRTQLGERVLGLPAEVRVDKDVPWADVKR